MWIFGAHMRVAESKLPNDSIAIGHFQHRLEDIFKSYTSSA